MREIVNAILYQMRFRPIWISKRERDARSSPTVRDGRHLRFLTAVGMAYDTADEVSGGPAGAPESGTPE